MAKITYTDKEFLNKNEEVAENRKVNDIDLNEIKEVVNENDDKVGNLSDLNTSDKSSLVNSINSLLPTVLYENDSGNGGNITLNDNLSNYAYIDVVYKDNDNIYNTTRVYDPDGKTFLCLSFKPNSSNNANAWWAYIKSATKICSGNQINLLLYSVFDLHDNNVSLGHLYNYIYITKVIGYK